MFRNSWRKSAGLYSHLNRRLQRGLAQAHILKLREGSHGERLDDYVDIAEDGQIGATTDECGETS